MPTIVMTIKLVNPPGDSGRGSIVGMDDFRLGVFAEKIGQFKVGQTYEIDYTDGKYKNVRSAKLVAAPSPSAPPTQPFTSGAYRQNGGSSAPPANPSKDEQIFVQGLLQALIRAGHLKSTTEEELKQELWSTTKMLRGLYKHTFGFETGRVPYDQAAE